MYFELFQPRDRSQWLPTLVKFRIFFFADHIDINAPLTRRELKNIMDSIGEAETCLAKIWELQDAYNNLDDYWSDSPESQRETYLIKPVGNQSTRT